MCKILQFYRGEKIEKFWRQKMTRRHMPLFAAFRIWATRHLLFGVGFHLSAGRIEWSLFCKTSQSTSAFVPTNDWKPNDLEAGDLLRDDILDFSALGNEGGWK